MSSRLGEGEQTLQAGVDTGPQAGRVDTHCRAGVDTDGGASRH